MTAAGIFTLLALICFIFGAWFSTGYYERAMAVAFRAGLGLVCIALLLVVIEAVFA